MELKKIDSNDIKQEDSLLLTPSKISRVEV